MQLYRVALESEQDAEFWYTVRASDSIEAEDIATDRAIQAGHTDVLVVYSVEL